MHCRLWSLYMGVLSGIGWPHLILYFLNPPFSWKSHDFFTAEEYSLCACITFHYWFICWWTTRLVLCLCYHKYCNNKMKNSVLWHSMESFGYMPRSYMIGSSGNFNFLKKLATNFHIGGTNVYAYQQWINVPPFPHHLQHLFSGFLMIAILPRAPLLLVNKIWKVPLSTIRPDSNVPSRNAGGTEFWSRFVSCSLRSSAV